MVNMIVKMSLATTAYVVVTMSLGLCVEGKKMTDTLKVLIGIVFGICSILSTHFGIDYVDMMLNVRDLGPLIAGLFFDPIAGLIAGFIGGIERYIAGTYFNVGSYTRVACSISTLLAGFFALYLNKKIFKGEKPTPPTAFFIGAVMEVFHMYVVLITHRDDMTMAFYVVDACSIPMIAFSAIGLAGTSIALISFTEEWKYLFKKKKNEEISISSMIQKRLFIVMCILMMFNVLGTFIIQSQTAEQSAIFEMDQMATEIKERFTTRERLRTSNYIGTNGRFAIYNTNGRIIYGDYKNLDIDADTLMFLNNNKDADTFEYIVYGKESICKVVSLEDNFQALIYIPTSDVFWYRNAQTYESIFYAILVITVVYSVISIIVNNSVVDNIQNINDSLAKITNGDLDEVIDVRSSKEFAILSDDINETVDALKGYIEKEKDRLKEDMEFASTIQMSALPRNFDFPNHYEFEMFALMDAAKGVGGDFYDFFFVGKNRLALVIADVSGKGVSGALFMMRAKTAIRNFAEKSKSPTETLAWANNFLCEGNEAEMFVTAWVGIVDLETGVMKCANFGHEYPIYMHKNGNNEIYKDNHSLPLAAFEGTMGKEYEIKLNPGDGIFLYTDGVPEATNKSDEAYGMERLISVLDRNSSESLKDILERVRSDVDIFADGAEQFDDITLFAFKLIQYSKID